MEYLNYYYYTTTVVLAHNSLGFTFGAYVRCHFGSLLSNSLFCRSIFFYAPETLTSYFEVESMIASRLFVTKRSCAL